MRASGSAPPYSSLTVEVGDRASRTRRVEPGDIALFTELTGDRNPLHYDEEREQDSVNRSNNPNDESGYFVMGFELFHTHRTANDVEAHQRYDDAQPKNFNSENKGLQAKPPNKNEPLYRLKNQTPQASVSTNKKLRRYRRLWVW